jgi:hypothetical protein
VRASEPAGTSYIAARAMLEDAKARAAQLDEREHALKQREQALSQRERELADQRRVLAEEYRLMRTQRPATPAPPFRPVVGAAAPVAAARTAAAGFSPLRHETAWGRIKRVMLGTGRSAVEEN